MDQLDKIPKPILTALAAVGFIAISSRVVSYIQLLLSVFVFSGKNVS